jgi:diguanylate cyclase (GGDEF)-like protein
MSQASDTPPPAPLVLTASEWSLAGLYLPAAVALFLLLPGGHRLLLLPALAGIAVYLLQRVIRLPLMDGYVSIVQPAFVVLLFALPLNLVAAFIPVGLFASTIIGDRAIDVRRLPLALADAWYCVPPLVILSLWAPGALAWEHWPIYLIALASELAVSFLGPIIRLARYRETSQLDPAILFLPALIDLLLTPFGIASVAPGATVPVGSVVMLASVLALVGLFGHERAERLGFEALALRDPLTGLANRALFDELLDAATRRLARSGNTGSLLFIDLDNFKQVNDVHGHLAGDAVLRATAFRIESAVRAADTVARFGGDEFAVLLADPANREAAARISSAIRRAVSAPIIVDETTTLTVTASIGIAALGTQTEAADAVARADEAMYEAKQIAHAISPSTR